MCSNSTSYGEERFSDTLQPLQSNGHSSFQSGILHVSDHGSNTAPAIFKWQKAAKLRLKQRAILGIFWMNFCSSRRGFVLEKHLFQKARKFMIIHAVSLSCVVLLEVCPDTNSENIMQEQSLRYRPPKFRSCHQGMEDLAQNVKKGVWMKDKWTYLDKKVACENRYRKIGKKKEKRMQIVWDFKKKAI